MHPIDKRRMTMKMVFLCFHPHSFIGKFRREFVSVLDRCRCSHHDVHSHHSFYLNAQTARLNTISPNTRSLYHYTSQRDRYKSIREKQVSISHITCSIMLVFYVTVITNIFIHRCLFSILLFFLCIS